MKSPDNAQPLLRAIPSVQSLLQDLDVAPFAVSPPFVKRIVQEEIERLREEILDGNGRARMQADQVEPTLRRRILSRLATLARPSLNFVVNATGIILHTNLGRAPLSRQARAELLDALSYCNLEIDLTTGRRGHRVQHVEDLLRLLTGAEEALVVNNNAAAVLLVLNSLARRKEVPISRGELVEIGGAFRMPDVMKASGAKMVEVGTTNKTHLSDYQQAISPRTGAILKVHTSNYRILGFTKEVELTALVSLAHQHNLPLIYDMGSGALVDLTRWNLPAEPVVSEVLSQGVDVVTFSGDKLLGGPQAGIILGKSQYLKKIKKNHLTRALRCDKLTYAALGATLRAYLEPEKIAEQLPVYRMLAISQEILEARANWVRQQLLDTPLRIAVCETESQMGSGALPLEAIPSVTLQVALPRRSPNWLAAQLRAHTPPVVGYVQQDALMLNLRTVQEEELPILVDALRFAVARFAG
ncbi:MAG: L-seryl-tRNA(Sec) selenium transferase [Calditrichaeota bacterium]|nr:MAG: L-seryl-tRNA(Sec) selenium transferase [Calditrichota bacterium]